MAKSDDNSSSRDNSDDIEKLKGPTNFPRWKREFQILAFSKNYWELYTGEEEIIPKPFRGDYFSTGKGREADTPKNEQLHYSNLIEEYRLDLDEWKEQSTRVREAIGFLSKYIEPALRRITIGSLKQPKEAFDAVTRLCTSSSAFSLS